MRSARAVLTIAYTPVGDKAGPGRSVRGFLGYIQYRDQHPDSKPRDVEGLLRYVAHRDGASPQGRLFGRDAGAGRVEQEALAKHVARSCREPRVKATDRAAYRLILSPEDARGLDLKVLTRTVMARLDAEVGHGKLPPWIAAEHRNTRHPHVHVVMAARRELSPGSFRTVVVTKERLATMKEAMHLEILRQRGERPMEHSATPRWNRAATSARAANTATPGLWFRRNGRAVAGPRWARRGSSIATVAARLSAYYRAQADRAARERGYRDAEDERKSAQLERGA
jgi:hypothetical protein